MARKKLIPQITAGYLQTGGNDFILKKKTFMRFEGSQMRVRFDQQIEAQILARS